MKGYEKELQQFIEDIKKDVYSQIIADLREEKMTLGEAKYLAKDFLALLPANNKEEVLNKLYCLTSIYKEAKIVFAKYLVPFEEEKTKKKLTILRLYMQKGDYDHAIVAMKGVN